MDVGYATGFFDGEGSVVAMMRQERYVVTKVSATQKTRGILDEFSREFGGKVRLRSHQKDQDYYAWELDRKDEVVDFLWKIFPFVKVKLSQVALALHLLALPRFGDRPGTFVPEDQVRLRRLFVEAIRSK